MLSRSFVLKKYLSNIFLRYQFSLVKCTSQFHSQSNERLSQHSTTKLTDLVVDKPNFPGSRSRWTEQLEFVFPDTYDGIPVYRVMNRDGHVIDESQDPNLEQETLFRMYKGN